MVLMSGFLGSIATSSSVNGWYTTLTKPVFNPPNYLFGPVWTLLYILMGIGLYVVLESNSPKKKSAVMVFIFQLLLNTLWSFIFFYWQSLFWGLVEIIVLWISIFIMISLFNKVHKKAAYLQIPYLLWVSFATLLNASLWYLNN